MWNYQRNSGLSHLAFTGHVTVDETYAAVTWLRTDVDDTPVRVVIDATLADATSSFVGVLMSLLEGAPVAEVIVIGAPPGMKMTFRSMADTLKLFVAFHATEAAWQASEKMVGTIRPDGYLTEISIGF